MISVHEHKSVVSFISCFFKLMLPGKTAVNAPLLSNAAGKRKGLVWMVEYDRLERRGRENYLDRAVLARRGYVRQRLLGTGMFSDVYCVEDATDGRRYACKVSTRTEMLEREARILAGLRHPLYPEFGTFWREEGLGILIREYVEGSSLEEMLGRRCFSAAQAIRWGMELAAGLSYLHGLPERFLFRDVKPANVIVRQDGRIKLIDLGCVCSLAGEVPSRAGSPGFAAPEQLREGGVLSASCDVYGLGKTLEAMLGEGCGSQRHMEGLGLWGKSTEGFDRLKKLRHAFRKRRARRQLDHVIRACTEEEAERRMVDMENVLKQLAQIEICARGAISDCHHPDSMLR